MLQVIFNVKILSAKALLAQCWSLGQITFNLKLQAAIGICQKRGQDKYKQFVTHKLKFFPKCVTSV